MFDREETVKALDPDLEKVKKLDGLLFHATAAGTKYDCVSRSFAPKLAVPEDPVCGSGHCEIVPYWAKKFGKSDIMAWQASRRGGMLKCRLNGDRVIIAGQAAPYSEGYLLL